MKPSKGGCYCLLTMLGSMAIVVSLIGGAVALLPQIGPIDVHTISLAVAITCAALALILMVRRMVKR